MQAPLQLVTTLPWTSQLPPTQLEHSPVHSPEQLPEHSTEPLS